MEIIFTADNILEEYPKYRSIMDAGLEQVWDSDGFIDMLAKDEEGNFLFYGDDKSKITELVDKFVAQANECLRNADKDNKPVKSDDSEKSDSDDNWSVYKLKYCNLYMPIAQKKAVNEIYRSDAPDDRDGYAAYIESLNDRLANIAKMRSQDGELYNSTVYAHYFGGATDIFITESDGKEEMFGFTILNGDYENAEFGYISISEITSIPSYELDFNWENKTLKQALYDVDKDYFSKIIVKNIDEIFEPPQQETETDSEDDEELAMALAMAMQLEQEQEAERLRLLILAKQ